MQRLPVQMMCWIFPGTSIDLNFAGRSAALCGMWRSPKAKTSTILLLANQHNSIGISSNDRESGKLQHRYDRWKSGTIRRRGTLFGIFDLFSNFALLFHMNLTLPRCRGKTLRVVAIKMNNEGINNVGTYCAMISNI